MIARRALQLLVPFLALLAASPSPSSSSSSDCPAGCACKWISGKETTLCTQLGLTGVPSGAAQGTQVRKCDLGCVTPCRNVSHATQNKSEGLPLWMKFPC